MSEPKVPPYGVEDQDLAGRYLVVRRGRCRTCCGTGFTTSPSWMAAVRDDEVPPPDVLAELEAALGPREVTCMACDGMGVEEVDVELEEALRSSPRVIGTMVTTTYQQGSADRRLLLVAAAVQGLLSRPALGPGVSDLLTEGVIHLDAVEHVSAAAIVVADEVLRKLDSGFGYRQAQGETGGASLLRRPTPAANAAPDGSRSAPRADESGGVTPRRDGDLTATEPPGWLEAHDVVLPSGEVLSFGPRQHGDE